MAKAPKTDATDTPTDPTQDRILAAMAYLDKAEGQCESGDLAAALSYVVVARETLRSLVEPA